ncbi:2-C-methyl-D-erythritol 4-phosphate cytidylyltransferase [Gordonia hankookensis]|uniref:2-C-methyl-D-erythritol 4-phosphate cytidylyltransferase n=1 Tax=Gordonia hankookensis TaxID=589403 RepID=A0ABR7WBN0_9ACTN|nr:2-C-methyl-D-erythritol 4-phosphate cytidylyltransferase [Gordonia hankookensis]
MTVSVVVPAAGSGTRLGEAVPKAFVDLGGGTTILEHCVDGILRAGVADTVVVVVPVHLIDEAKRLVPAATVVAGGSHRSESVRAGIAGTDSDIVLVHDAARPFTPPDVFHRVVDAVRHGHLAVVPGLPVADTLKEVDPASAGHDTGEAVIRTVDRERLRAIQTPQGFTRAALMQAHADASGLATDDAGLAERAGIPVHVVAGDPLAMKITTPWDLRIARDVVAETSPAGRVVDKHSTPAGRVVDKHSTPAGRVVDERSEETYRDHRTERPS